MIFFHRANRLEPWMLRLMLSIEGWVEGFRLGVSNAMIQTSSPGLICPQIIDAPRNIIRELINLFKGYISCLSL